MKFNILIFAALRNLNRNKKRSVLTMIGIVIGIAAVITIVALGQGYKAQIIGDFTGDKAGEVIVNASFVPDKNDGTVADMQFFDERHKLVAKQISSVKSVEFQNATSFGGQSISLNIRGTTFSGSLKQIEKAEPLKESEVYGRSLSQYDIESKHRGVFIPEDLIKSKFNKPEELVGGVAEINGISFEIVGIKKSDGEGKISFTGSSIEMPKVTYDRYFTSSNKIKGLKITLDKDANVKAVMKEIENKLNELPGKKVEGKYKISDNSGIVNLLGGVLNTITTFIAAVAAISLFIAGIGLMNMMYTSVSERTKEIGIKRALGAKRRDIRREFLIEGIVITMIGGLLGYIIGIAIAFSIGLALKVKVSPSLFTSLLAIGISIVIGIASSFIPARKAANQNTVDILK